MNNTYLDAIHCDIHLDMKKDCTLGRVFQELSLSELETLQHLCELERTQILQSLALAALKHLMQDIDYQETDQILSTTKKRYYGITHALKSITVICF